MNSLFDFLNQDKSFARAITGFTANASQIMIYGLNGSPKSALIAAGFERSPRSTLIITATQEAITHYRTDIETFISDTTVLELPAVDIVTFSADAKSLELAAKRMNVLSIMATGQPVIVLATAEAAMQRVIPLADFLNHRLILTDHGVVDRDDLLSTLVRFGYERTDEVNSAGQFAARGGIIDVFPLNQEFPIRLELFGDEADSLREFDPATQRSVRSVSKVEVLPVVEPEHSGKMADLFEYLPTKATVVFDEPARIREQMTRISRENPEIRKQIWDWQRLVVSAQRKNVLYLSLMAQKSPHTEPGEMISVTMRGVAPYHRQMDLLTEDLREWQAKDASVVIFMSSREKAAAFSESLAEEGVSVILGSTDSAPVRGTVLLVSGVINSGF